MNIKLIIATHKEYNMPESDIYFPIHVGKEGNVLDLNFATDNTGDNISAMNDKYCELTGLYWAWKNLNADYIGLVHYRRHFVGRHLGASPFDKVLNRVEVESLLQQQAIILPKKRNYYIQTIECHYSSTHKDVHLAELRRIFNENYPEYVQALENVLKRTFAHMFNMFIMKRDKLDAYADWLFRILSELDKQIDSSAYSAFEKRYLGRVSEILLDVWIEKNGYSYVEVPIIHMEGENWPKKLIGFLKAAFFRRAYS
jgi:hypothetical protein